MSQKNAVTDEESLAFIRMKLQYVWPPRIGQGSSAMRSNDEANNIKGKNSIGQLLSCGSCIFCHLRIYP
jgi:hypothetical protein